MKVLSLFSGIGAFEKALNNLGVPFDLVQYCEIDPDASRAYAAIHDVDETLNLVDITTVNERALPRDIDLITYGFPCQDISCTGKQKGLFNADGTLTRSGLFFDALRIIKETAPPIAIAENVKNLTSSKFSEQFNLVLSSLEEIGYNNYWSVLKASDHGIPQTRERVFIVSIRKDVDNGSFKFPAPCALRTTLASMADFRPEDDLTEAFYARYREVKDNAATLEDFLAYVQQIPTKENAIRTKDLDMYSFNEMNTITLLTGLCGTLTCRNVVNYNKKFLHEGRLFRPSPRMCFRLMGFTDEDFNKAQRVTTDQQLYKQAGNSIVVQVAERLLSAIFEAQGQPLSKQEVAATDEDDSWLLL